MQFLAPEDPVLVLCPHPDDEMGCGGLIAKLTSRGQRVHYCYFSDCAESTRALGFEPQQLIDEMRRSCAELGIRQEDIVAGDIPVRYFPQHRQPILELLVSLRKKINPKLVLTPCTYDMHQDHATVTAEAVRAFKYATILGYELPWNSLQTDIRVLVTISSDQLKTKFKAWSHYETQRQRVYSGTAVLESLARLRGVQADSEFAEGYEIVRAVV